MSKELLITLINLINFSLVYYTFLFLSMLIIGFRHPFKIQIIAILSTMSFYDIFFSYIIIKKNDL